jgi:uncharacterized cupredoxin-like copper-binding protein
MVGTQSVKQIRAAVDRRWASAGPGTPTPLPLTVRARIDLGPTGKGPEVTRSMAVPPCPIGQSGAEDPYINISEEVQMRALRALAVIALGVSLAACGGTAAAPASVVKLTLSDFKYSSLTVEIPADQKVTFELKNEGSVEHDMAIEAIGFKASIQPGKTATRNIGPLKAGEYEIVCTVLGHKELGMVAKLVVR